MRIVNDILDLSKLEAGKLQLEQGDLDVREVVAQVRSLLSPMASQKGLSLTVCIAAELDTRARGDAMRLQQVLNNLISNAIKFTQRGGVSVAVAAVAALSDGMSFRISVSDTGIGIERSAVDRVFDPFEQADNSTSRQYGGTGLGLAIVKRLVQELGGDIAVESTIGRGSTFTFTCCFTKPASPRVDEPTATPAAAPAAGLPLENLKVLLVEDNLVNQLYAQAILHKHECETTVADNGIIAVECWRSARFDLILMDCHMPEMDGFEATRAIRAHEQSAGGSPTPIVGITASALPSDREACLAAGMDDVLVKPFSPQEFVDAIARWCKPVPSEDLQPTTRIDGTRTAQARPAERAARVSAAQPPIRRRRDEHGRLPVRGLPGRRAGDGLPRRGHLDLLRSRRSPGVAPACKLRRAVQRAERRPAAPPRPHSRSAQLDRRRLPVARRRPADEPLAR